MNSANGDHSVIFLQRTHQLRFFGTPLLFGCQERQVKNQEQTNRQNHPVAQDLLDKIGFGLPCCASIVSQKQTHRDGEPVANIRQIGD